MAYDDKTIWFHVPQVSKIKLIVFKEGDCGMCRTILDEIMRIHPNLKIKSTRQFGFHVPQVSKINLIDELSLRSEIVESIEQSLMK